MSVFEDLGLRPVVNAAGKMTYLGGSTCTPAVTAAMAQAASDWVSMDELLAAADRQIAAATGAEAGHVTSCTAAGLAIATAACLTGGDLALTESLPELPAGRRRKIVLQKGHAVHFGAPFTQMLRMAGAEVVEVGTVSQCGLHSLEAALADAAGVFYVVSHHAVSTGMLSLAQVVAAAHTAGVPVVVDAAAELDLRKYIATGADLVIYSGHKALGAPTSGMICGRRDLVAACAQQNKGIGRAMKIGKENIVGLLAALRQFLNTEPGAEEARQHELVAELEAGLQGLRGLTVTLAEDAGRPIRRVRVAVDGAAVGMEATELVRRLEADTPSIRTRAHHAAQGWFEFDPRPMRPGDPAQITAAVKAICAGGGASHEPQR